MKSAIPVLFLCFLFSNLNSQSAEGMGTILILSGQPGAKVSIPAINYKKRIPTIEPVLVENVSEGIYFIEFKYMKIVVADSFLVLAGDTTAVLGNFRDMEIAAASLKLVRMNMIAEKEKQEALMKKAIEETIKNDIAIFGEIEPDEEFSNEEVFYIVEDMPTFNGGDPAIEFRKFIGENLRYPEEAVKKHKSGRVVIQFMVNSEGRVVNPVVVAGVCPELDAEAVRVVLSSPPWKPGFQRGKPVGVLFTFPINFTLN